MLIGSARLLRGRSRVLRHSGTTGAGGYVPLMLLPIVLLALFGSRRELLLGLAGMAVTLLVPFLVFGEPRYPDTAWRSSAAVRDRRRRSRASRSRRWWRACAPGRDVLRRGGRHRRQPA